jgi:hypothetical protein
MMAISDADRKIIMEKNKAMCTCGKYPACNECTKGKMEPMMVKLLTKKLNTIPYDF